MRRTILLASLLAATALPAHGQGLDLTDPRQIEICAALAALSQTMAEQAIDNNYPAKRTETYRTLKSDPNLSELADVIASLVDRLSGRMRPGVIRSWSMYGFCRGYDDDLIFGEAATKVGAACNTAPDGTESQCIESLLRRTFESLSPEEQGRMLDAARDRGY